MLTSDQLRSLLYYDANSGEFIWRVSKGTRKCGACAGNNRPDGYVYIKIDRKLYRRSRLIWLYLYDKWPEHELDHINGNTSDDRLDNLREATHAENMGNKKKYINNTSGIKGVFKSPYGRYRAYVSKAGKRYHLGTFRSAEEAHQAYMAKAKELFGEFARP